MGRNSCGDRSYSVCPVVNSHKLIFCTLHTWLVRAGYQLQVQALWPRSHVLLLTCSAQARLLSNTREQSPTPPLASAGLESLWRFILISKSGARVLCLASQEEFGPWLMGLSHIVVSLSPWRKPPAVAQQDARSPWGEARYTQGW